MKHRRAYEVQQATQISGVLEKLLTTIFVVFVIAVGSWLWLRTPSEAVSDDIPLLPVNTITKPFQVPDQAVTVPDSVVKQFIPPSIVEDGPTVAIKTFETAASTPQSWLSSTEVPRRVAPDFTLSTFNGEVVNLGDFRGKGVILNFWASWCPPCRDEMPLLTRAFEQYQDQGLMILAINATHQDTRDAAAGFISEFRLPFPVLLDEMGHVTDHLYNVFGLPVSVFIDRDGKISRVVTGGLFQDEIDGYIAEILK
jgi:peroxiredoxin